MLAFRNAGAMSRFVQGRRVITSVMSRFVQGRRVITSHGFPDLPPENEPFYHPKMGPQDPFGRPMPRPIVEQTMDLLELLTEEEKYKFRSIFSELLGLPKPPEESTKGTFAVKLVKYDPERKRKVLREVAWVKSTVKVIKDYYEVGLGPSIEAVDNVPSVIKEGVSEEEANEIIAKIKAAGGDAVKELLD